VRALPLSLSSSTAVSCHGTTGTCASALRRDDLGVPLGITLSGSAGRGSSTSLSPMWSPGNRPCQVFRPCGAKLGATCPSERSRAFQRGALNDLAAVVAQN